MALLVEEDLQPMFQWHTHTLACAGFGQDASACPAYQQARAGGEGGSGSVVSLVRCAIR